jgi:prepilin-type N-terminal cleavage/methylation domain-containing protein
MSGLPPRDEAMDHHDQVRIAERGSKTAAYPSARCTFSLQPSVFDIRPFRRGLTLIELLVTIVIMVTVLAGALPLLSPNNNSRKIREASRQLTTLLSQAQAQAARDGRPVGVAFSESGVSGSYSGVALEAYMIAEPPPFTGFSEFSRVSINKPRSNDKLTYGQQTTDNANGNDGTMFDARYRGVGVWELTFSLYGAEDPIPPRMVRNGDVVNAGGNYFLIVDDGGGTEGAHEIDQATGYVLPTSYLLAIWLNQSGQQLAPGAQKSFSFARLPVYTSEQPLQFPRGIGIDMHASGATGVGTSMPIAFDFDNPPPTPTPPATNVSVMFSPNGSIEAVYRDGVRQEGAEQIFLLLGLFENGNNGSQDWNDYDFSGTVDNDELAQRRTRLNWLNADSRWVTINRAGRIITTDNNISFDPRTADYLDGLSGTPEEKAREQRRRQLVGHLNSPGARQFAQRMSASTGR